MGLSFAPPLEASPGLRAQWGLPLSSYVFFLELTRYMVSFSFLSVLEMFWVLPGAVLGLWVLKKHLVSLAQGREEGWASLVNLLLSLC